MLWNSYNLTCDPKNDLTTDDKLVSLVQILVSQLQSNLTMYYFNSQTRLLNITALNRAEQKHLYLHQIKARPKRFLINLLKCQLDKKINALQKKVIYPQWPLNQANLFDCLLTQIANKPVTWQQKNAFRWVKFKPGIKMQRKRIEIILNVVCCQMVQSEYFRNC